jgi:two-component system, cell cycle response regulator CpdR
MARILVVDDEPLFRTFVASVLQIAGHQTTLAADGLEALESPGPFDLLLTDLMMPRMTGGELARRMRQRNPVVKVLYLTGAEGEVVQGEGGAVGRRGLSGQTGVARGA